MEAESGGASLIIVIVSSSAGGNEGSTERKGPYHLVDKLRERRQFGVKERTGGGKRKHRHGDGIESGMAKEQKTGDTEGRVNRKTTGQNQEEGCSFEKRVD